MRRPSGSLLVSIAIHAVLGLLLLTVIRVPHFLHDQLSSRPEPQVAERIGFLRLPDRGEDTPGRSGGDGRPLGPEPAQEPRLVAPAEVPVGIPEPQPAADGGAPGGAGPVIGRGGIRHGIMPSSTDPRLWRDPPREPTLPRTPAQRVDSVIDVTIRAYHDSMAAAPRERRPGDWTFERGGRRYGMDEQNIYIADRKLPNAVLALLPLNVQSNPIAGERERSLAQMRQTIQEQSQRAATDADVSAAFKRIRERKDRERSEREAQSATP